MIVAVVGSVVALAQRSGLSEEEITKQLSQILPGVVDKLTPQGRWRSYRNICERAALPDKELSHAA
jgi:uncharacterized protein YidB (DUF937 family)